MREWGKTMYYLLSKNSFGGKELQNSFLCHEFDSGSGSRHFMVNIYLFLCLTFLYAVYFFQFVLFSLSLFNGNLFRAVLFYILALFFCHLSFFSSVIFLVFAVIFFDWARQNKNGLWRFGLIYPLVFYSLLHISRSCCGL